MKTTVIGAALCLLFATASQSDVANAQPSVRQTKVNHRVYSSYFESNQSGLKGATSRLVLQNQSDFNRIFGAAATMGNTSFLPDDAFKNQMIVATIKRGKSIWNYSQVFVDESRNTLTLRYSARAEDGGGASFASPLVVSVPKKSYDSVVFVENGVRHVVQIKKPKPAPPLVISNLIEDDFFQGTYRVGATTAQVKPIKMAFEVKWANRRAPQIFFYDSNSSQTVYISEGARPERWVFVDESLTAGYFQGADGKKLDVRRVSKSVAAKPQTVKSQPVKPQVAKSQTVKIYLVALNDNGKIGRRIGCGDSIVPITRTISSTSAPLQVAIEALLNQPAQDARHPHLKNFWTGRNLGIQTLSVRDGVARIHLSGEVFVAGVCDQPRIIEQIETTAKQFSSVKSVKVFMGRVPLSQAVS